MKRMWSVIKRIKPQKCMPWLTWKKNRSAIARLYNNHKGDRCFVIGNGPSLNSKDLDLLKNEICFASNQIFRIFPDTEWRPTYYCIQDHKVLNELAREDILKGSKDSEISFLPKAGFGLCKKKGIITDRTVFVPIVAADWSEEFIQFGTDLCSRVFSGKTVTYLSIQLAAYMGYKDIILLGVDNSFPYVKDENGRITINDLSIPAHFYETAEKNSDPSQRPQGNYHDQVTKAYLSAEVFSRKNGFRIFNATRGGKLEVFERVNLESILFDF